MILVTGASGYIGNNIVRRLVDAGKPVRAMVHSPAKAEARLADIARTYGSDRIEIVQGDVTRPDSLAAALEGASAVVHLVAVAIEKNKGDYERINTQGTVNMVDAAQAAGVRRLINMSQNGARSDSPYRFLASKGAAQDYVAQSDLDWTALRPSVVWGPQDEFANVQARLIKLTPLIFPVVGDGQARFQPIWVGDLAEATARSLDNDDTIGHEYLLGGPEVLTYEQIVNRVLQALKTRRWTVNVPVPLLRPVVKLMEITLPNPPVTTSLLNMLNVDNTTQPNALTDVFGVTPRAFAPENLAYMREFSAVGTLKRLLGNITADEVETAGG
jgi:uncharacterized protein YbjT (DUF2867 family)